MNTFARFEVPPAVLLKMQVFWDVAPCPLVNSYQRFKDSGSGSPRKEALPILECLTLTFEARSSFETPVTIYRSIRRNMSDDLNFQWTHLFFYYDCPKNMWVRLPLTDVMFIVVASLTCCKHWTAGKKWNGGGDRSLLHSENGRVRLTARLERTNGI
jgi:hypothetical protein